MIDRFLNVYLPFVFDWVIETSIMASALLGVILFAKAILRNKLSPRWHYFLWIVLIVRLLLPWSPDSAFNMYSFLSYSYEKVTPMQNQLVTSPKTNDIHETNETLHTQVSIDKTDSIAITPQAQKEHKVAFSPNKEQKESSFSFYTIASYIWIIGVIILCSITYLMNRRLHHYIKKQPIVIEEKIVHIFNECKNSMAISQNVPLLLVGKAPSPTVFGLFRPKILLSNMYINRLSEKQLKHIFYHEFAHIKRKDIFINWIMHCLLIVNWFNPLLWYAYFRMREDQELACDAFALTFLDEKEQHEYGYTIINLLEHQSNSYPTPGLANLIRNKKALKRRIFMIKKFQRKSYRWSVLGISVVGVVSLFSLLHVRADVGQGEKQKGQDSKQVTTEMKKETTIYTPPKQQEHFEDMTKEEVFEKMMNAINHFETAKGEFKLYQSNAEGHNIVNYEISLYNNAGSYTRITHVQNKIEEVSSDYFWNGTSWSLTEDLGVYTESKYYQPNDINNEEWKDTRALLAGLARPSLRPKEITSNYMGNFNSWEIEKQNEELLGHNTLVIKGTINKSVNKSFRFWVDKDTGILVKYETYDAAGKLTDYLHPTSLEVNIPVDSKKFTPDLTGYKREIPGKDQPSMTTGNIDSLVPEVMKEQWEEAKGKPNKTTTIQHDGKWYIHAKKGYVVNNIEVNGTKGTVFLTKTSPQKERFIFHVLAEGYNVESLEVVYE
ncbi:M56 family metallopeptidase [Bacillus manliponensis]|uniref:M56 family metallopeptidase n=1 Tax=Bacillus manliponensis TaxID=574376 RepID=UPI0035157819